MANAIDLNKVCLFVCTGASRGIGQKMTIECSKKFRSGSVVILFARSLAGLKETKAEIFKINPEIKVFINSMDLTQPKTENFRFTIAENLAQIDIGDIELCFFIHNVGTIGSVEQTAIETNDAEKWHKYLDLNLISVIALNSELMEMLAEIKKTKLVVNITSKAAISPFKSMAHYCTGKAAREMFFRVFAEEEIGNNVVVLNYSPGPVDTDMSHDIKARSGDAEIKAMFQNLHDTKTILTTDQTTAKFLQIIQEGNYKSGDHVDYYD